MGRGKMVEKEYNLVFNGYWIDEKKSAIPSKSGIYCVYECTYNPPKEGAKSTVNIHRLIYIGEADNVNDRIANHEKRFYGLYKDRKVRRPIIFHISGIDQKKFRYSIGNCPFLVNPAVVFMLAYKIWKNHYSGNI